MTHSDTPPPESHDADYSKQVDDYNPTGDLIGTDKQPPSAHSRGSDEMLRLAVAAVLEADTEFRSNMMPGWEGDPLSDEIDGLRRIFEASPAPSHHVEGTFDGAIDTDTPLQAAAREAGWALSEIVDSLAWSKRGHVSEIIGRLGAALLEASGTDFGGITCPTCEGTGKEGRHSICRDCDENPPPQPHKEGRNDD